MGRARLFVRFIDGAWTVGTRSHRFGLLPSKRQAVIAAAAAAGAIERSGRRADVLVRDEGEAHARRISPHRGDWAQVAAE